MQNTPEVEEEIASGIVKLLQTNPDRVHFVDIPAPFRNAMILSQFGILDRVLVKLKGLTPAPYKMLSTVAHEVAPYSAYLKEWVGFEAHIRTQMKDRIYLSNRGFPLLAQVPMDKPIVCLENYVKWYSVQLLGPQGNVQEIPQSLLESVGAYDRAWIQDHCYHPKLLHALAHELDAYVDILSLEATTGRWVLHADTPFYGGYFVQDDETL